ncbi:metal ABC transporter solute-binding protein, Zn/Mn family [Actinomycetospora cinnamomea]|uniref:Zinc/manganese transport system substrate-binding protein n=1 Tax=Actinomycetospora cinnamomea TaxID=663609 RepID=A0A2U1EDQ6_9PSEU|nr:zinc ABC transporter substrate-binding protein [Actinomycetospora cinnamomea]PVY98015.1 zinc/manganese transport system substrate-binding protein [Actinomycetospora cinnamomea]
MSIPSAVRGAGRGVPRARRTWLTALVALSLGLVAACGSGGQQPPPPSAAAPAPAPSGDAAPPARTLNVVASTNVWGDIASRIAGQTAQVRSIITDPNTDPHSYEATPADAAAIGQADLIVYNGGHYDEWVERALDATPGAREKAIEAFALRPDQAEENEHVWFDPATVNAFARQVADRLGQVDPGQAQGLTQRANEFTGQVDQINQQLAAIGQARPGLRGLSSEPVPFYLERAAGITDVTPPEFAEAIEEETDPPAAAVAETNQLLTSRAVDVLFFNPQTESPVTVNLRTLANQATIPVVEVGETLPAGRDYVGWLTDLRSRIASAVGAPQ